MNLNTVGEGWTEERKRRLRLSVSSMETKTDLRLVERFNCTLREANVSLEEEIDGYAQYVRELDSLLIRSSVLDNIEQYSRTDIAKKFLHELTHMGDLNPNPRKRMWTEEQRVDAFVTLFNVTPSYTAPYYGDDLKLPFHVVGSGSDDNRTWMGGTYYRRGAEVLAYMVTRFAFGKPGRWYRGIAQLPGGHFTEEQNRKVKKILLNA